MIQVQKQKNKIKILITTELDNGCIITLDDDMDREDVYQLVSDLNKWLEETLELPKFTGIDEEAVKEAYYYSQQKRLLEESMKEYIASIKPTQHIQKELQTIELDAINREVEVTKTKLKENVKRK